MDLILVIVIAVLALAVGACVAYFVASKKSNDNNDFLEESERLRIENFSLNSKVVEADKNILSLNGSLKKTSDELEDTKKNLEEINSLLKNKEKEFEESLESLKIQLSIVTDNDKNPAAHIQFQNLQDEISSYKKKISSLEGEIEDLNEEIEDAEYEVKKYKRRLEEKTECYNKLETLHREITKKNEELKVELENRKKEIEEKVLELSLKIYSLDFVKEILIAKKFDDTNFVDLEQKVNVLSDFIINDLKLQQAKLSKSGIPSLSKTLMNGIDDSGTERWAVYQKKTWIQGKKAIAFVGEFSAGKTSIVNRILQDQDKNAAGLPVSTKATTAIPTYISGGTKLSFSFITPSNIRKKINESTFKQVNKEILGQIEGISALIKYFVMTYRNPALDHISILDTPGFNSNDEEDAIRTSEVINECDALFWVMDVNAGEINNSSRAVIKKYLNIPLFIVINKIDTKAPSDVKKAKQKIATTLSNDGIEVQDFILFGHDVPISEILSVINNKVVHKGDQDNFIRIVRDNMKKVYEKLKEETSKANKEKTKYLQEADLLQYEFENYCKKLTNIAERLEELGEGKSKWFRKDVWELSQEEKKELNSLCMEENEYVKELTQLSIAQKENAKNSQRTINLYSDFKSATNEFAELSQKFIKYAKDFQIVIRNQ